MFLSRSKKNNVYPCKPQFYYLKMGFKGVKIIYVCFRDAKQRAQWRSEARARKPQSGPRWTRRQTLIDSSNYLKHIEEAADILSEDRRTVVQLKREAIGLTTMHFAQVIHVVTYLFVASDNIFKLHGK